MSDRAELAVLVTITAALIAGAILASDHPGTTALAILTGGPICFAIGYFQAR